MDKNNDEDGKFTAERRSLVRLDTKNNQLESKKIN